MAEPLTRRKMLAATIGSLFTVAGKPRHGVPPANPAVGGKLSFEHVIVDALFLLP